MESYLLVTFKVTSDGEAGHPMDHIIRRIPVDADGEPDPKHVAALAERIRAELRHKARR